MTLDDETASRIANETWAKRGKRHTVSGEEYVRAGWDARDAEVEGLRSWKAQAIEVLDGWERVWEATGKPGLIGAQKSESVRRWAEELRYELVAFRDHAKAAVHRAEKAEATLAKVREWAESVTLHPDPPADDEMAGQINAAGDVLAILSPTERETCADEWEWGVRHVQADGWVNVGYYPDRESALDDYLICGMDCALVRRRKAGPWEVCDDRA